MICPSCGAQNPDDAALCGACQYRFRFGHAFNDPAHPKMPELRRSAKSKKSRVTRYLILTIIVVAALLAILLGA
jgi:uncharacterized membrane protein YvbJ